MLRKVLQHNTRLTWTSALPKRFVYSRETYEWQEQREQKEREQQSSKGYGTEKDAELAYDQDKELNKQKRSKQSSKQGRKTSSK